MSTKSKAKKLHAKDIVPNGYVPITDVCKAFKINQTEIETYRKESFKNIYTLCKKLNVSELQTFWNANVNLMESDVNFFLHHDELAPIAHLIKLFKVSNKEGGYKNSIFYSFGISKSSLKKYSMYGIIDTNSKVNMATTKTCYAGRYSIWIDWKNSDESIELPKVKLFYEFKQWCKERNCSIPQGTLFALDMIMKKYPLKRPLHIIDPIYRLSDLKSEKIETQVKDLKCSIDPELHNMIINIIHEFNKNNPAKIQLKDFVESALVEKVERTSIKYKNPKLYKKIKSQKENLDYYKEVLK